MADLFHEKSKRQFDALPYPQIALDADPRENLGHSFVHDLTTARYLRDRTWKRQAPMTILDIGCGSGYTTLSLAYANPQATRIIGVDLSDVSLAVARERLRHHGFTNAEFYPIGAEAIGQLNEQFDYINCQETLYLLPDPAAGLQMMQSVLKPDGIIRANLHSLYERWHFYRAQELFHTMGLMGEPGETAVALVAETLQALAPETALAQTWNQDIFLNADGSPNSSAIQMNYLFQNDKGFTIPQMFDLLQTANLELVSMVNWHEWNVADLFQERDNLPLLWGMSLATMPIATQLQIYELINPRHRLLDFWAGHPQEGAILPPPDEWSAAEWQHAQVHLHPQLNTPQTQAILQAAIAQNLPFTIHIPPITPSLFAIPPELARVLLPLFTLPQSVSELANQAGMAEMTLIPFLQELEKYLIVLLTLPAAVGQ